MPSQFVLLLGVEDQLFKACFGTDEEWAPQKLVSLDKDCSQSELVGALKKPGIGSVVIMDIDLPTTHLQELKDFFESGGTVAYFGIYGEFTAPIDLCTAFGLGERDTFGYQLKTQPYTKANLLSVPVQDRWMVAKPQSLLEYIEEIAGDLRGEDPDEEWEEDAKNAKERYVQYCEGEFEKCPLAVHQNRNGGKLAYMGFVNGDGHIPKYVRFLLGGD